MGLRRSRFVSLVLLTLIVQFLGSTFSSIEPVSAITSARGHSRAHKRAQMASKLSAVLRERAIALKAAGATQQLQERPLAVGGRIFIDFENIEYCGLFPLPKNYAGFKWNENAYSMNISSNCYVFDCATGYSTVGSKPSGTILYTAFSRPVILSSPSPFSAISVRMAPAWELTEALMIGLLGGPNGTEVARDLVTNLAWDRPLDYKFPPSFGYVDALSMVGVYRHVNPNPPSCGTGGQMAFDDLVLGDPVGEPPMPSSSPAPTPVPLPSPDESPAPLATWTPDPTPILADLCSTPLQSIQQGWNEGKTSIHMGSLFLSAFLLDVPSASTVLLSTCSPNYPTINAQIFVFNSCPPSNPSLFYHQAIMYTYPNEGCLFAGSVATLQLNVGTYYVLVSASEQGAPPLNDSPFNIFLDNIPSPPPP